MKMTKCGLTSVLRYDNPFMVDGGTTKREFHNRE